MTEPTVADGDGDDAPDFAAWVGPHLRSLTMVAIREVGRADAEDIVQQALTRAWQRRETFDAERGSTRVWLVAVLLDQARRHRRRHSLRTRTLDKVPDSADPDERVDVERAVRSLPQRQRQVITLFYLADLSVNDIAAALAIAPGTVKSQLSDARGALKSKLEIRP